MKKIALIFSCNHKCLKGEKTEDEAREISMKLLQYSKEKWPVFYQTITGKCKQEDAGEFLLRILTEDETIAEEFQTPIAQSITCSNKHCNLQRQENIITDHIHRISLMNKGEVELQEIVTQIAGLEKAEKCAKCMMKSVENKFILKATRNLIIEVNRKEENGTKMNTKITCSDRKVLLDVNGRKYRYNVTGVIIHKGTGM